MEGPGWQGRSRKKLIEAGREWASASTPEDEEDDDAGDDLIVLPDKEETAPPERVFYVHPDNWQAFEIFTQLRTQWRIVPTMSAVFTQGLDYSVVLAVIDSQVKKRRRRTVFQQIRLLEAGALSVINGQNLSNNATDSG